MILKISSPKKSAQNWRLWLKTMLNYWKNCSWHWSLRKTPIFWPKIIKKRQKLRSQHRPLFLVSRVNPKRRAGESDQIREQGGQICLEKNRQICLWKNCTIKPTPFLSIHMYINLTCYTKWYKDECYFCSFQVTGQSIKSPVMRKFAQSGHPVREAQISTGNCQKTRVYPKVAWKWPQQMYSHLSLSLSLSV
jgi:hypothetical protein